MGVDLPPEGVGFEARPPGAVVRARCHKFLSSCHGFGVTPAVCFNPIRVRVRVRVRVRSLPVMDSG